MDEIKDNELLKIPEKKQEEEMKLDEIANNDDVK